MPKLTKPFPELKVNSVNLKHFVEHFLKQKNYSIFEIREQKLEFIPFYVFEFEAFSEHEHAKKGKIVSASFSGKSCLNASTKKLDDSFAKLFSGKTTHEIPKETPFAVMHERISLQDAKKSIPLQLSKKFSVPKENIFISSIEGFYLPIWHLHIEIEEQKYPAEVNAVSGKITAEIPDREKNWSQLVNETFSELKSPKAWVNYSSEMARDASNATKKVFSVSKSQTAHPDSSQKDLLSTVKENILHNDVLQLAILVIILMLLISLWQSA